jgi:hypothetical protein
VPQRNAGVKCNWATRLLDVKLHEAAERLWSDKESSDNWMIVQNQEPICAGVIAGGALMGIAVILIENFALCGR